MHVVSVNIPVCYIKMMKDLTDSNEFPSRSELIRIALRDFLRNELLMVELLLDISEKEEEINLKRKKNTKIDMRSIRRGWKK